MDKRKLLLLSGPRLPRTGRIFYTAYPGLVDSVGLSPKQYALPTPGGAIIHVDGAAVGAGTGADRANAFTTVQAGIDAATAANTTIRIWPGTYAEKVATKYNDIFIVGASGVPSDVVINGSGKGGHTINSGHRTTWLGLTATGCDATYYNFYSSKTLTLKDFISDGGLGNGILIYQGCAATLERVVSRNSPGRGFYFLTDLNSTMNFCEALNNHDGIVVTELGGSIAGNNVAVIGNLYWGIYVGTTYPGNIVFNNLVAHSNAFLNANIHSILNNSAAGGTLTINNTLTLPTLRAPDTYHLGGVTDGGGNIGVTEQSVLPVAKKTKYPLYVSLCIDDFQSLSFWKDFADLCEEFGFVSTYALNTQNATSQTYADMAEYIGRGHDIASHTVTHPDLVSGGLTAQQVADELVNSKAAIEAGIGNGFVCRSFVPPGNATDATVQTAIKTAGYLGARGTGLISTSDKTHRLSSSAVYKMWAIGAGTEIIKKVNPRLNIGMLLEYLGAVGGYIVMYGHNPAYVAGDNSLAEWRVLFEEMAKHPNLQVVTLGDLAEAIRTYDPSGDLTVDVTEQVYTRTLIDESDYEPADGSVLIASGVDPFAHGAGDQYDAAGYQVWSDTTNLPDGHWLDGVDIGAYAAEGANPYYLSILGVDGAYYWPSAPELIARTGVDNAVYNADGTGKEFASHVLALAAMATVEDNIYLFVGPKGAVLYSTDQSANLAKIQRAGC